MGQVSSSEEIENEVIRDIQCREEEVSKREREMEKRE